LQQTTVATVGRYFQAFTQRWPRVEDLAAADLDDVLREWAGLGYYARARNLHACAKTVADELGGRFPETEQGLQQLPGIGPYTAAAIAAIAFNRPAAAVDGNVERVISRLRAITEPLPASKPAIKAATLELVPPDRPGDFAQALMDLGATVCSPKTANCLICPWVEACAARSAGMEAELPRKAPKKDRPVRRARIYWAQDLSGRVLMRGAKTRGCWAACWSFPQARGTRQARRMTLTHRTRLPGTMAQAGWSIPSHISICCSMSTRATRCSTWCRAMDMTGAGWRARTWPARRCPR
jgi:A/G-specific adenine glycosylase